MASTNLGWGINTALVVPGLNDDEKLNDSFVIDKPNQTLVRISCMDDAELYEVAFESALAMPGAEEYMFAPEWSAVRVAGKWFMLATEREGAQLINLKAAPADVLELTAAYEEIHPGYHMNKKHWITLTAGGGLDVALVRELVESSYALVARRLPKAERPYLAERVIARYVEG